MCASGALAAAEPEHQVLPLVKHKAQAYFSQGEWPPLCCCYMTGSGHVVLVAQHQEQK